MGKSRLCPRPEAKKSRASDGRNDDQGEPHMRGAVTVIGLGLMGSALARAFLVGGHPTTVWNRTARKADPLVAEGAVRADSVPEAFAAGGVVVLSLIDYSAVREVLDAAGDALRSGATVVNLSSGTVREARELAAWAAERNVRYLDGSVMAVPQTVGGPEAAVVYSGSGALLDEHRPVLDRLAGTSLHLGDDPGLALLYENALAGMLWSTLGGYLHALALVGTEKVAPTDFLAFAERWHTSLGAFLPVIAEEVGSGTYTTDVSTLDMNQRALAHLVETSEAQGLGVDVLGGMRSLIHRRVADGHGDESLSSVIEVIRAGSGTAGEA
ncbi:NAD(P)-binding domain-containing protein [Streptomyces sp. NPDC047981]|uniref:NAD(P)-dependent oxidoreductase n=1 Tax=Streptomyces sp. NPDC047981 TaxID=3154610 RepID=UPI00342DB5E7